jgi:hypothetical protein
MFVYFTQNHGFNVFFKTKSVTGLNFELFAKTIPYEPGTY